MGRAVLASRLLLLNISHHEPKKGRPSFVEVNKRSVVIRTEDRNPERLKRKVYERGLVTEFSKSSQRRLARLLLNNAERFKYFFTLTYGRNNRNCKISKRHLDYFLTRFRKSNGKNVGYVWVLEFQVRGAVHFHIWFEDIKTEKFMDWQLIEVRKQIQLRFKDSVEDLNRFKYLTYLWLLVTEQLGDLKTMKASTDLKAIYSKGFTCSYGTKYLSKKEQKVYPGNVDEETGEICEPWIGRYWGASGSVKNEKVYFSENPRTVRIFRNWYKKLVKSNKFSGLRLMYKEAESNRVSTLLDDLDRAKFGREVG